MDKWFAVIVTVGIMLLFVALRDIGRIEAQINTMEKTRQESEATTQAYVMALTRVMVENGIPANQIPEPEELP